MSTPETVWAEAPGLSDKELKAVTRLVYEKSGITLHSGKRALVLARLQKRVMQGGFGSFENYLRHVQADGSGDELTALLDAIATNHTSFFRESQHFDFLRTTVLPPLQSRNGLPILGWSAACSSGEEPYTLAMTCIQALGNQAPQRVRLLASDLSTKVLRVARAGVYNADRVANLPFETLRKFFEKGLGAQHGTVRVSPEVRRMIDFQQINLLEVAASGPQYDFIFCRNVMIYFDAQVQQRVVQGLERRLAPGGHLFISHSESLNGTTHGLTWVAPAIYRKAPR
jgi:chemotaxis protein methyltransferase CheR